MNRASKRDSHNFAGTGAVGTIEIFGYSPGSITLFFAPVVHDDPEKALSKGCAVNVSPGVHATASVAQETLLKLNGRPFQLRPAQTVVEALAPEPVEINFETVLPIGCGFGVSAACCLSAAFCLSKQYDLDLSRERIGSICHSAEVANRTGIGDVASQLTGGVVLRECVTGPLDARRLEVVCDDRLYSTVFGPIATSEVLSDRDLLMRIVEEGEQAMNWIKTNPTSSLTAILDRSRSFAAETGLLAKSCRTRDAVERVSAQGGHATMVMLGEGMLSTAAIDHHESTLELKIDTTGAF